jgi:DNA-binding PadR family transcriptional regulator
MTEATHRRSPLAVVVLTLLAEEPMHAYRMQQLIKERGKDTVVNVSQRNSVYQTIDRLVRAGLVEVHETARDSGRPERTIYRTTGAGRRTLQAWLRDMLAAPGREYPEFPAAVASMAIATPADVLTWLEQRVGALEERLAQSQATAGAARAGGLPRLFLLEDEYQDAMTRAELEWVRGVCADLRSGELTWHHEWLRGLAAGPP